MNKSLNTSLLIGREGAWTISWKLDKHYANAIDETYLITSPGPIVCPSVNRRDV